MSGHNIPFEFYQSPLSQPMVTETSDITIDRMGCVIPVSTPAAVTATLQAPTRAGIIGSVVLAVDDSGYNLTLEVTDGYNADGDTDIAFTDAQDFVTFISIDIAGTFYWRVLGQEGTNAAVEDFTVDTLAVDTLATIASAVIATSNIPIRTSTILAAEHGAGAIGTGWGAPRTARRTVNGVIITEIRVDLQGLDSSGIENDVIGLADPGTGAAYIGKNVVATNGVIYRVEWICLETPAGGDDDILLVAGSAADETFDDTVANTATLCDTGGAFVAGKTIVNDVPSITTNYYYYLTQGGTTNAVYTAGQFIMRTYGHAVLVP